MTVFQSWLVLAGSGGFMFALFAGIAGIDYFTEKTFTYYLRERDAMRAEELSTFNRLRLEWTARAGEKP